MEEAVIITVRDQVKCVEREIAFRKRVYPKWVELKKMSPAKAELEIKVMESIKVSLLLMPQEQSLLKL